MRIHFKTFAVLLPFALALLPTAGAESSIDPISFRDKEWRREAIAAGVEAFQGSFTDIFDSPQTISLLRIDLQQPGVRLRFRGAYPRRERRTSLPNLAEETGAIGAINGGFSFGGRGFANCGILKIDGELYPFVREAIPEVSFAGGSAIGILPNEKLSFAARPETGWPEDWPEVQHALAGGHRLLENGEIHPSIFQRFSAREELHAANRHPRSAIGITAEERVFLVTVDGRHSGRAHGMTLEELALFMQALGCVDAMNLDGGGAATMWIRDFGVVNHPSDNAEFDHEGQRRLRSAILVFADDLHAKSEDHAAGQ